MVLNKIIMALAAFISMAMLPMIAGGANSVSVAEAKAPYKILHVMSYHSPWRWTDGQLDGFKEALKGVKAEYSVFQMDLKRNSTKAWKSQKFEEVRHLIDYLKPDLVYTSDDNVQELIAEFYVNTDMPFVFSGVNKDPKEYGFRGSRNVAGVVEHELFVESVRLLKDIAPDVRRIAVVFDDASMWIPVMQRMRDKSSQLPDVTFVSWDTIRTFAEYQQKIKAYPQTADAVALIGIFNFKDAQGANVPYQDVLRWTAENSRLPDFGFWIDRVHFGTLCAVNVSEFEQGLAAGKMAYGILVEGKRPSDFPMQPTLKGYPIISLARANKLGLQIKSGVLLTAEIIPNFEWEK